MAAAQSVSDCASALGKGSGVDVPTVHRFLKRERGVGLTTAAKLARYMRLELTRVAE